ncbi:MAG: hypothetical protein ABI171_11180 [Collimonas sp.]|uniref:hypothetical protein n=1 Tax=Collimonas sp. TaxID=1963772 RepID=UPI0032653231
MSIPATLNAICDLLKRETGLPAKAGVPGSTAKGLFVWPYRLVRTESRAVLPRPPGAFPEPPQTSLDIPLLVLARPAFSDAGLDMLDAAMHALMENTIVTFQNGQARLSFDTRLDIAELCALFTAARLQPGLALELVARTTITRGVPVP